MCKLEGLHLRPERDGLLAARPLDRDATSSTSRRRRSPASSLPQLSEEVGDERDRCWSAAARSAASADDFPNLTVKKIPKAVLAPLRVGPRRLQPEGREPADRTPPSRDRRRRQQPRSAKAPAQTPGRRTRSTPAHRRTTSMNRHVNAIASRLSLRPPQRDSLEILDRVTEIVPPEQGRRPGARARRRSSREYPDASTDFERDFPSLCFALATGVGKTRLMGAFIAYLHLAQGIRQLLRAGAEPDDLQQADRRLHARTRRSTSSRASPSSPSSRRRSSPATTTSSGRGVRGEPAVRRRRPHQHLQHLEDQHRGARRQGRRASSGCREYIGESYFEYLAEPATTSCC